MNDYSSLDLSSMDLSWLIWLPFIIIALAIWSVFWKGLALWHSARRAQPWWFGFMLILNTLGLLEIIYIFGVAKVKADKLFSK
jgi:hypothetical protein